jgi:hypothetical protein
VQTIITTRRRDRAPRAVLLSGGKGFRGAAELVSGGEKLAAQASNRQALGPRQMVDFADVGAEKLGDLAPATQQVIAKSVSVRGELLVDVCHSTTPRSTVSYLIDASTRLF